jgi:Ca2+-binding EF-hand superfamily protein
MFSVKKSSLVLSLWSLPVAAVLAFGANVDKRFAEADKDGDGKLTREEAEAMPRVSKNFDKLDADKQGYVTLAQLKDAMERK